MLPDATKEDLHLALVCRQDEFGTAAGVAQTLVTQCVEVVGCDEQPILFWIEIADLYSSLAARCDEEGVFSAPPDQEIAAPFGTKKVISTISAQDVLTLAAVEIIIPAASSEEVFAIEPLELVVSPPPNDEVVLNGTGQEIVVTSTDDSVWAALGFARGLAGFTPRRPVFSPFDVRFRVHDIRKEASNQYHRTNQRTHRRML